jgi:hypothetical protein
MIIRSLIGEWRAKNYLEHGRQAVTDQFLFEFNLNYPMRKFLRTKISELAENDPRTKLACDQKNQSGMRTCVAGGQFDRRQPAKAELPQPSLRQARHTRLFKN